MRVALILVLVAAAALSGCGQDAVPCDQIHTISDPKERDEALKRCPRSSGQSFKPSPEKKW